jgi:hypothetical protein
MTEKTSARPPSGATREERLARQLRENLKRRKAQARSRAAGGTAGDSTEDGRKR